MSLAECESALSYSSHILRSSLRAKCTPFSVSRCRGRSRYIVGESYSQTVKGLLKGDEAAP
jgi:hypothetical protein